MEFSDLLINWYWEHKRELPWRETTDPYKIWISEIILQQTRVVQGMEYYHNFLQHFPDVKSLAEAEEEEVLKCWQGLGYYSRARNLHFAAQTIMEKHGGTFPLKHEDVLELKGIGDYTAAAICSFAYGQPYAAVDGNFFRVLARVFEIETPIDSTKGKKDFYALAQELISKEHPALFNQAMMDIGATVCTPTSPNCQECPLQNMCLASAHRRIAELPVKSKKNSSKDRYFYYFLIKGNGQTYLHRREENDIWKGLYELPLVETPAPMSIDEVLAFAQGTKFSDSFSIRQIDHVHASITHILSHQRIHATLIETTADFHPQQNAVYKQIPETEMGDYPVSRLTEILLGDNFS